MKSIKPLDRDKKPSSFRDDRLIFIVCDDTYAPKQYFDFFKIPRVKVIVSPSNDRRSAPVHVLSRLINTEAELYDSIWMLLDTDHNVNASHAKGYISAIKAAKQKMAKVAISRPCFEYWLILHHIEINECLSLASAKDVEDKLRQVLGSYNKANLVSDHFPFNLLCEAYKKARDSSKNIAGGYRPTQNKSDVYLVCKDIFGDFLPE